MNFTDCVDSLKLPASALPTRALIHAEEIADACGVCIHTVYRWLKSGAILGARRIGRRWMAPRTAVIDFLGLDVEPATGGAN